MFCRKENKQRKDKKNYSIIEAKYGGGMKLEQDFGGET
jgi:hypothetical protein